MKEADVSPPVATGGSAATGAPARWRERSAWLVMLLAAAVHVPLTP
jgi:hypothetical protein